MRALSKLHLPAGVATRSSKISHVACSSMGAPNGQRLRARASLSHGHPAHSAISASSLTWRRASSTDAPERSRFDSAEAVDKEIQEANERCVGCVVD